MASKVWTSKALKMGWHDFVCAYVAAKTAKKPVQGYTFRAVDGGMWELLFAGTPVFRPMTASTAYSWFVRTAGLCSIAREADEIRVRAHIAIAA